MSVGRVVGGCRPSRNGVTRFSRLLVLVEGIKSFTSEWGSRELQNKPQALRTCDNGIFSGLRTSSTVLVLPSCSSDRHTHTRHFFASFRIQPPFGCTSPPSSKSATQTCGARSYSRPKFWVGRRTKQGEVLGKWQEAPTEYLYANASIGVQVWCFLCGPRREAKEMIRNVTRTDA